MDTSETYQVKIFSACNLHKTVEENANQWLTQNPGIKILKSSLYRKHDGPQELFILYTRPTVST